jgi:hypothetical protein
MAQVYNLFCIEFLRLTSISFAALGVVLLSGTDSAREFSHDEEAFRRKIPWPLVATNVKGAYAIPPPPDDFDISTAGPDDLIGHGLLWPGPPISTADPLLLAAWRQVYSQKWRPENRVIPEFGPNTGITHVLDDRIRKVADSTYTTSNWSGVAIGLRGPWAGNSGN